MRVTGVAQRDAWLARTFPPVEQVRPDLWSVPVPIPDSPLRYTLTYLLTAGSRLIVVDPGWDTEATWRALVDGLAAIGASPADTTGVVVTHIHPDHHGLSARLRDASGAWVAMHPVERDTLAALRWQGDRTSDEDARWLRQCGVPDDVAAEITMRVEADHPFAAMADPDLLLAHGDLVPLPGRRVRAVHTPGHTPGHLCLHEEAQDVLLTGDHVLPRISPSVAVHVQQPDNPLADFLDALARVRDMDIDEVLPAHEWRFRGLAPRVDELLEHHRRRLDETEAAITASPGITCWETTLRLRWSRDWSEIHGFMRRAAVGETLAHLVLLERSGRVHSSGERPVQWYPLAKGERAAG